MSPRIAHAVETWLNSAAAAESAYGSSGTETIVRISLAMDMKFPPELYHLHDNDALLYVGGIIK
jgi:hypothetical protein